jgi:cellulose 1,4-beta-cellobiosidase
MRAVVVSSSVAIAIAQQKGTQTAENHPQLAWSTCTAPGQCQSEAGKVVIDANWRWLHKKGETTNCYTGNKWDASICPDAKTCSQNCVVEGADAEYTSTYGVHGSGNKLQLDFVTQGPYSKNIGSRTFLMQDDYAYKLFQLKNKEFTYTVDDSNLDCGLNGALYFVQMDADGGKSKYGNAGAEMGLGYCDAQCPHDLKFINNEANVEGWNPSDTDPNAGVGKYGSCCTEIDIWEANKMASAYTMHACSPGDQTRCSGTDCGDNGEDRFKGMCDKNGCDIQPHRLGVHNFFGPGSDFQVDSTKPVQVTTQFITNDGTDHGKLVEVKQFYTQDGKTIEHPAYTVNGNTHSTITDDFCNDWVATTQDSTNFEQKGGLGAIEQAIDAGVVLVMSLWDDHYANMLWLDSTYPVGSTDPGTMRGTCSPDSGKAKDVESKQANAHVIFSDIKFGAIGSTTNSPTPGPSPSPTPTPPAPTPSPTPSGCPGGSLSNCIDLCPADAFAPCVESCQRRCPGVLV